MERSNKVFLGFLILGWLGYALPSGYAQEPEGIEAPPMEEVAESQPEVPVVNPGDVEAFSEDDLAAEIEGTEDFESIPAPEGVGDEVAPPPPADQFDESFATAAKSAPDEYMIQPGDTLWDICEKFLGNPWYWPKLWSLNEYIQNPHLIFPGNTVRFYRGSEVAPPQLDIVSGDEKAAPPDGETPPAVETKETVAEPAPVVAPLMEEEISLKLKSLAFISKKELREAGKITHSGEPKLALTYGDRVYLKFRGKQDVSVGNKYQIFDTVKKVSDPDSLFSSLGYLIKRKAVIKVIGIYEHTVEATILDAEEAVTRGDRFIPYENPIRKLNPHEATQQYEGRIVEAENQQYLISNNDFVFLNLGKKHGVDDGLKLFVVRRGDGVFQGADKKLPYVIVGHLMIVETRDRTSTAYVTSLRDSLAIGDKVLGRLN